MTMVEHMTMYLLATMYSSLLEKYLPEYYSVLFNRVPAMTGRIIRNVNINLRPPRLNTTLAQKSFCTQRGLALE